MEKNPLARRLAIGAAAVVGAAGLYVALPASAQTVQPTVHVIDQTSNATCSDFAVQYGGGQTWLEVKFDPPKDGTKDGITIDVSGDTKSFTWTSTVGIDAVYVKSGSGGSNLYVYAPTANSPEAFSGSGTTPGSVQEISHISFCWDTSNPTTTTSTTVKDTTTTTVKGTTTTTVKGATTTTTAPAKPAAPAQPVVAQPTFTG